MASCECCWESRSTGQGYEAAVMEHEMRGCICTENTEDGRKARAGQFWKDGRDIRESPAAPVEPEKGVRE